MNRSCSASQILNRASFFRGLDNPVRSEQISDRPNSERLENGIPAAATKLIPYIKGVFMPPSLLCPEDFSNKGSFDCFLHWHARARKNNNNTTTRDVMIIQNLKLGFFSTKKMYLLPLILSYSHGRGYFLL